MQLHQLKPIHKNKSRKRIGRGGKRGAYSGRGLKGQKSRAGRRIKPATREILGRLPKLRGVKFRTLKSKAKIINLDDLERKIGGDIIDRKVLIESGLIKKSDEEVKILSEGELTRAFKVSGLKVSKKAREKIEKVGGRVL